MYYGNSLKQLYILKFSYAYCLVGIIMVYSCYRNTVEKAHIGCKIIWNDPNTSGCQKLHVVDQYAMHLLIVQSFVYVMCLSFLYSFYQPGCT